MDNQLVKESVFTSDRLKEFSVVGIAVSPSKLRLLKKFLDHLDIHDRLTYVIMQIGSSKSKAIQIEQFSNHTKKKVIHAQDHTKLLPDSIYLLPRHHNVAFHEGRIDLSACSSDSKSPDLPADQLMKALVRGFGSNSIGILFSGSETDGIRGIDAIAKANGLIMVDEKNSKNPIHLTESDIEVDRTDYIFSPQDMPGHIIEYIEFYMNQTKESIDMELKTLFSIIKQTVDMDFSLYKQSSVMRRIRRRMGIHQIQYLKEYNNYLHQHDYEVNELQKDLLIGVTEFFRDPLAFTILEDKVIPAIFERQQLKKQIRVWVPGCSTGEEVYSIAILINECMKKNECSFEVKIFATDLDKDAIHVASKGVYSENITKNVEPGILKDYFTMHGNHYKVNNEIRQMVIFAQHNLLNDPPFIQMDLVSCRNLLIYFQPKAQRKVISKFHFSLIPEACLFLGPSETLGKLASLFTPLDRKWNIFQNKKNKYLIAESSLDINDPENEKKKLHKNKIITRLKEAENINKLDTIYTKLIEDYVAACIIVDENNEIIHITGDANQYLSIPKGKPSLNLLKMVPEYLAVIIGTALNKARIEQKDVLYCDVDIKNNQERHAIDLTVKSFNVNSTNEKLMILFFEKTDKSGESSGKKFMKTDEHIKIPLNLKIDQHIESLDKELLLAKDSVQLLNRKLESSNEELVTSVEELKMANEQLIVSNEELQSTNEELQSGNEEVIAVNNEYQFKINELTDLNTNMTNFFNSTNIATVLLDEKMIIRKFTPAAANEINLNESQIGLSIEDLLHNLKYEHIADDARSVLLTGVPIENEVQSLNGEWFAIRILPYLSLANIKEGVVLILVNVTEQRRINLSEKTNKQFSNIDLMNITEMRAVAVRLVAEIDRTRGS